MAKTHAERQRDYRLRQKRHESELLREQARLRAENERLRQDLAGALAEAERLSALACKHPAGAVDGGRCHACGSDID